MRPTTARRFAVLVLLAACGDDGSSTPPDELSVGGTYQTGVTLLESTCTGTTVQQHPTTVAHARGSHELTLTHAGSSYAGTVDDDGHFTTVPVTQVFGGVSFTLALEGDFTETAMDARVTVDAARQPPCRFVARWAGAKSGAPNVIP